MSEQNESAPAPRRNPLMWIALAVVGLILFVFLGGDRGGSRDAMTLDAGTPPQAQAESTPAETDTVDEPDEDAGETVGGGGSGEIVDSGESDEMPTSGDSGETLSEDIVVASIDDTLGESTSGTIERSLLVPPGMRARQYIEQLREAGEPYPLSEAFDKAQVYQLEGSLADAHLLYFFAAREGHLPAIMVMAEMSDPLRFDAANALLDSADVIQAYKWYSRASELGQAQAASRLDELAAWAEDAAGAGDPEARQLLLNIQ